MNNINYNVTKPVIFYIACFFVLCAFSAGCGSDSSDSTNAVSGTAYYQNGGTAVLSGKTYTSTVSDENAVKVYNGGTLTISDSTITKSGATSDKEKSGFYGFNSGVLASSSSAEDGYTGTGLDTTITMTGCTITTNASGANGAFAFGENAVITLDDVTIETYGSDNSRGVDATYGGTVKISNSTISTTGGSCAALATDRYESYNPPSIIASNVTGETSGTGSPGIYCTGTFTVTNSTLTATGSEAAAIEGLNSITLSNTSITGNKKWGVIIYQSMSGDSSTGTGTFNMTGGTLTNNYSSGPLFFVCDTSAVINLNGATISNSSDMLLVAGTASAAYALLGSNVNTDWGTNGGTVTLTATDQALAGKIILCDSSSSIAITLKSDSSLSSTINTGNTGTATLALESTSTWTATGDSYLSSLTDADTTYSNIDGACNIFVNGATSESYTSAVSLDSGGKLYIK